MADIPQSLRSWSSTAGSNSPSDSTTIGAGLDDNLRSIQATVRQFLASVGTNIASAATTDLATMDGRAATLTGNVTITGFGTEPAGIGYDLIAASNPLITHNSAAINCPGAANLQLNAGDVITVISEGSGIWRIAKYLPNVTFTGTGSVVRAASPTLTGTPLATTQASFTANTSIATTEFISLISPPIIRTYTSTTGWAKPSGLKGIIVEVIGGGGAGGTANSNGGTSSAGGGGGAGGYARKSILAASLGASVTVTVGAAGSLSAFQAHCTATAGADGTAGGADTFGAGGLGGAGANGDVNGSGSSGHKATSSVSGMGGSTFLGGGGINVSSTAAGGAAQGYGAGGGGAFDTSAGVQTGGVGAQGIVIVTEYY